MNFRRSLIAFATSVSCLGIAAAAVAEPDAYMRIKGKSIEIKGDVTQKGREGTIVVHAIDHTIVTPVDTSTGMATGKRQHKPFVITKEIDRSSPALHQALTQNETLTDVSIQFFQVVNGVERNHYTVALKNARIVGLRHVMPDNNKADLARLPAYEELTLVYESITWTWNDGGLTASDTTVIAR